MSITAGESRDIEPTQAYLLFLPVKAVCHDGSYQNNGIVL